MQTGLRETFGWVRDDYWFPEVRSLGGAIVLFSCVLYPYVYLLVRTAFLERAGGMIEAARALGLNPWQGFWRVSIPLARPAIAAGMALALMETLADYGTVAYFAVQTFTTGIYRAWFSLGDRVAAAQLAAALLGFVALLILLERISRGRARYHDSGGRRRATRQVLTGWHALLAQIGCAIPVVIGFVLPAVLLLRLAMGDSGDHGAGFSGRFLVLASNSFTLAALLNVDIGLNIPDFRAREKVYQEIVSVCDLVAAKGEVIIQTRFPRDPLFRHLRDGNYDAFATEELAVRAALNFPPYTKLLKVLAYGNADIAEKIMKIFRELGAPVEIFGPTEKKTRKGVEFSFLLRHAERKLLHAAARAVVKRFSNAKDIEIRIDADPY